MTATPPDRPDRPDSTDTVAGGPATTRRRVLQTVAATATGGLLVSQPADATDELASSAQSGTQKAPVIGANVNGGVGILNANGLIERSNTTHIRARLDIRAKAHNGTPPANDPDVQALRRAARQHNCTLIISLLWDFDGMFGKSSVSVPTPGSQRARTFRRCAARYLRALGENVAVVVLGNEPMWETQDDDLTGDPAPFVRFIDNIQTHLDRHANLPSDPAYLVGSLNRLYDDPVRENNEQFLEQLYSLARGDRFDGLDLHIHYDTFDEARKMVRIGRNKVPNGLLTVTEFSAVHRYRRHMDAELGDSKRGKAFAAEYGYPPTMTVFRYLRAASNNPRPRDEIAAFYRAMPWYNATQIQDLRTLFTQFDVAFGSPGFAHGYRARKKHFDTDWRQWPFHINHLYQPGIMKAPNGIKSAPHPLYMDAYRG